MAKVMKELKEKILDVCQRPGKLKYIFDVIYSSKLIALNKIFEFWKGVGKKSRKRKSSKKTPPDWNCLWSFTSLRHDFKSIILPLIYDWSKAKEPCHDWLRALSNEHQLKSSLSYGMSRQSRFLATMRAMTMLFEQHDELDLSSLRKKTTSETNLLFLMLATMVKRQNCMGN